MAISKVSYRDYFPRMECVHIQLEFSQSGFQGPNHRSFRNVSTFLFLQLTQFPHDEMHEIRMRSPMLKLEKIPYLLYDFNTFIPQYSSFLNPRDFAFHDM